MNIEHQIAKVAAAQGLNRADAVDQIQSRIYEARQYLKARAQR